MVPQGIERRSVQGGITIATATGEYKRGRRWLVLQSRIESCKAVKKNKENATRRYGKLFSYLK